MSTPKPREAFVPAGEAEQPAGARDATLVERARQGDALAQEALYCRHVRGITALVRRLMPGSGDAEDIVQETFATALDDLDRLRDSTAFRSWLYGIAVRRVRRTQRWHALRRFVGLDTRTDGGLFDLAHPSASPETLTELALIDAALARCPVDERIAWVLRRVQGEPLERVARIVGVSLATVKRRVNAVDVRLRAHIERGAS